MRVTYSYALKQFFSPAAFLPFFIGAICLAVLGNEVTELLNSVFGTSKTALVGIAVSALFVLILCAWGFQKWLARFTPPPVEFKQKPPGYRRGLVVLVGRQLDTCRKAIEFHQPILERCWLICSQQSLGTAQELKSEYEGRLAMPDPLIVNDVNDPLEYRNLVNGIYQHLPAGWNETDVIADYTGMTAHASVGMALACLGSARPLQYTPPLNNADLQAISALDPIEIELASVQILKG
jgi:hypothetical protein